MNRSPNTSSSVPILVERDAWLQPAAAEITARGRRFASRLNDIRKWSRSLSNYANAHLYFGIHYDPVRRGWWFREWLPGAKEVFLFGDFNDWERTQYPAELLPDSNGVWSLFLPDATTQGKLRHGSRIKMYVHGADGQWMDRIPAYIRRVVQNETSKDYSGQVWEPPTPFDWSGDNYNLNIYTAKDGGALIYEAHVGMAQEREGVGTYDEFTDLILPKIKKLGYNTVQLMAVAEHPYYGSFGYHVSNFFAPSSRFGTPEDLKRLVKRAHELGIGVIMDLVHSHYVKNTNEGINRLDGTDCLYSVPGPEGEHPQWDSMLFDYGKYEVQHFLLSNIKYWLDEFHFDGFRFDGVTSMLYHHHGVNAPEWGLDAYFGGAANKEAILYLTLANELVHELRPGAITIAEDVSGMPGVTAPIHEGGMGFDYRLGMAIPDFWIEYLKDVPDEKWDLHRMWEVLCNRLPGVRTVAYCESHDQALVGDKTIAFRLMDKEMYFSMNRESENLVVDRGIALHKMIRLITSTLGGEAYLTFMGNEFGHPEWIDFPREGNGWSYAHARRQWSLAEADYLRYIDLVRFDEAMVALLKRYKILSAGYGYRLQVDETNQTLVYEQGGLLFVFNWHPCASIPDYEVPMPGPGKWRVILSSDDAAFGGQGRVRGGEESCEYFTYARTDADGITRNYMRIYNVSRTAVVFERVD
ncbi:alpha-amylase family glycosyl hydrolase [uncultured Rikenella sp.]|uniref:alpha-amylase family glycosyl hydrolase n=1 Tax=uncultured Rikenella sp. TaxID=368003 RepID=UPI0026260EB0|nr:alpha-amylase family glycosyl hydrolase [uncultured Rikenella sp.]